MASFDLHSKIYCSKTLPAHDARPLHQQEYIGWLPGRANLVTGKSAVAVDVVVAIVTAPEVDPVIVQQELEVAVVVDHRMIKVASGLAEMPW